jgi:hypothetical protein
MLKLTFLMPCPAFGNRRFGRVKGREHFNLLYKKSVIVCCLLGYKKAVHHSDERLFKII